METSAFLLSTNRGRSAQSLSSSLAGNGWWEWKGATGEVAVEVPMNIREFIEQQVDRVSPEERRALEAASVVGIEFSAAAVAAGIEQDVEAVEDPCDALVRREQFLRLRGTEQWPDGTVTACYGFVHALYQEVLYDRVPGARRARLHRRIGERGAEGYGERVKEIAVELAVHFERGRDYRQAARYLYGKHTKIWGEKRRITQAKEFTLRRTVC